ncbi:MAG: hypothetical protein IK152_01205 [Lachnospiraceae bacterium]|nr:hypothetical protein [Lachnospiraceae bacterium]
MENERIYWHAAFPAAMKLEFRENKENLEYETEFQLNAEPISVDLLIIKKPPEVMIKNELGRFFKEYNLLEYKGPGDELNIDVFFKGLGYASLYKAGSEKVDSRKSEDITLTFVRESYPRRLFQKLTDMNIEITNTGKGLYRIAAGFLFDIQIIVTGELDENEHLWIVSLTKKLHDNTARNLVSAYEMIYDKDEKISAHAVFDVVERGNREVFKKLKEEPEMHEVLMEIMKPDIDKKIDEACKERDAIIAEKDADIAQKNADIAQKNARIKELEALLAAK